jgi:tetratricopeptide (TPR) repeat protein
LRLHKKTRRFIMSVMLGNRYFIARQYEKAIALLEEALPNSSTPEKIKKKLVICYVQVGKIERALFHFHDLVRKDPKIIIDTDPYHDDCPCYEIIPTWEKKLKNEEQSQDYYESLGMLYLYCNKNRSIQYFEKALENTKFKTVISSILKIITEKVLVKH